jgi:hypothetical protein
VLASRAAAPILVKVVRILIDDGQLMRDRCRTIPDSLPGTRDLVTFKRRPLFLHDVLLGGSSLPVEEGEQLITLLAAAPRR